MDGLLKEHVKKLKPKTAAYLWGKYAGGYTDALNHVLPILDEAQKDFPDKMHFGFKEDGTKIYDVWDWFEKWFGNE